MSGVHFSNRVHLSRLPSERESLQTCAGLHTSITKPHNSPMCAHTQIHANSTFPDGHRVRWGDHGAAVTWMSEQQSYLVVPLALHDVQRWLRTVERRWLPRSGMPTALEANTTCFISFGTLRASCSPTLTNNKVLCLVLCSLIPAFNNNFIRPLFVCTFLFEGCIIDNNLKWRKECEENVCVLPHQMWHSQ